MIVVTCKTCGKVFNHRGCFSDINTGRAKYCNRECSDKARIKLPRYYICKHCGKKIKNTQGHKRVYCSLECRYKGQVGTSPGNKGKETPLETKKKQSISKIRFFRNGGQPWNKGILGENSHSWMGGFSKKPYSFDFNEELKELIRKRDNWKCQHCGAPQEEFTTKLCVHHIDYDKMNCNPTNLIVLCNSCNLKANCNREYWEQYYRRKI